LASDVFVHDDEDDNDDHDDDEDDDLRVGDDEMIIDDSIGGGKNEADESLARVNKRKNKGPSKRDDDDRNEWSTERTNIDILILNLRSHYAINHKLNKS
jgi:hypothetical protein